MGLGIGCNCIHNFVWSWVVIIYPYLDFNAGLIRSIADEFRTWMINSITVLRDVITYPYQITHTHECEAPHVHTIWTMTPLLIYLENPRMSRDRHLHMQLCSNHQPIGVLKLLCAVPKNLYNISLITNSNYTPVCDLMPVSFKVHQLKD